MAATAAGEAGLLAEDLGDHLVQVDALGDGDMVRTVGGGDYVFRRQVGADADGARLLAVG
ncbi:hypothetical protein D3C77_787620 [compost metagenome]